MKWKPAKTKEDIQRKRKILKELKAFLRLAWFLLTILFFGGIVPHIYLYQKQKILDIDTYIFNCGMFIFAFVFLIWAQKKMKLCEKLFLKDEKKLELNG